jgi:hyperpolarization activated cyclic nucleotide-gated potassium channel 1
VSNYLDEREIFNNFKRLVVMLYFALTTLSTVGYGDYHPASNIEMMVASLIMLGGVAFFSYIMSTFLEIISSYDAKMGSLDRSDELNEWIVSLERFT